MNKVRSDIGIIFFRGRTVSEMPNSIRKVTINYWIRPIIKDPKPSALSVRIPRLGEIKSGRSYEK